MLSLFLTEDNDIEEGDLEEREESYETQHWTMGEHGLNIDWEGGGDTRVTV